MRTISQGARFRRDYKRLIDGIFRTTLKEELPAILQALAHDLPLPPARRDHPLSGAWNGCRDCHVRGDLVLIYRKPGSDVLELVRLGTHSELNL